MEKLILKARELGQAVQESELYLNMQQKSALVDTDAGLQDLIGKFNLVKINLNNQLQAGEKDQAEVERIQGELRELYAQIMDNPNMIAFNAAKQEIDGAMTKVNMILSHAVNGEDPMTMDVDASGCGGSCSSCAGCH